VRPLVETPGSNQEYRELIDLLLANGIRYHETPFNMLAPATIWVDEADYEKAFEIASSVEARYAKQSKAQWDKDWKDRYKESYARWFVDKIRKPGNVIRIVLLIVMLGVFVGYPIVYAFRRLIAS
jgi:hypothetical protein